GVGGVGGAGWTRAAGGGPPSPAPTDVTAVCFDAASRRVLIGTRSGSLELWDTIGRGLLCALHSPTGPITAVAFAPDELTCAVGGENGQVIVGAVDGWAVTPPYR